MMGMFSNRKEFPVHIAGSSIYGRYPKICSERTYNMIISDDWLVPNSGYRKRISFGSGTAKLLYSSAILGCNIAVLNNNVYFIRSDLSYDNVGTINTTSPNVYVAENNNGKIIFCDGISSSIWIYDSNFPLNPWSTQSLDFVPCYLAFQDGYFVAACLDKAEWRLAFNDQLETWPNYGGFQTKPDFVRACVPIPGKGGQIFIIGSSVTEMWSNVGNPLFPYKKNTSYNIDYGCINSNTIAFGENIVVWLGANKDSGPVLMYSTGGDITPITSDGINYKISTLKYPDQSSGFLYKQDGHLFYQLTFLNSNDNFSLLYDFTTKKIFDVTDVDGNYHIAKNVSLLGNKYYMISHNDINIYEIGSSYYTYDDKEIPMVRIANNIRFSDSSAFIANYLTFPIEQGEYSEVSRIDLSASRDGGVTFSGNYSKEMRELGKRENRCVFNNLGYCNEFIPRLQFWGTGRIVAADGVLGVIK